MSKIGVIFDLDGTLLDTLDDLLASVNYTLEKYGYPLRKKSEVQEFVGNGIRLLMKRALPSDISEAEFSKCFATFEEYYRENLKVHSRPYPGIMPLLENLKGNDVILGIVSNKFQKGVELLKEAFFFEYIQVAIGNQEGLKTKPAPDMVDYALKLLSLEKKRDLIFYVGDSDVDIKTAKNSGLPIIAVSWGFRSKATLNKLSPDYLVEKPEEIIEIISKAIDKKV
ncbi:MAG: HAD family hydrolase [Bacilli bacterium]|nr:HAD family hydrolase [Bacilli bacterium]